MYTTARCPAWITAILVLASLAGSLRAGEWYVAPNGAADGSGTRQSPWDVESALLGRAEVKPGDTIYLRAGTYRRRPKEQFEVKLAGAEGKPIHVKPAPGERVTIDGGLLVLDPSQHLWIWGLEILVSEPQPEKPVGPGSHPEDFKRPWGGLNVQAGKHNKYIHLVIHDCRQGVSWWAGDTDGELYGCIIYDNGWPATDRGHGHAIYTQNKDGTKTISDNIMTGGHSYTLHAYGSERAYVDNYLIQGNICYDSPDRAFLIGGGRPSRNIRVFDNVLYGVNMQLGYDAPHNEDCQVKRNLLINAELRTKNYRRADVADNRVIKSADPGRGHAVVLRPSAYDPDRANLAVYDEQASGGVDVAMEKFLKPGDSFRLMDPRNFFGKPVLEGKYTAEPVRVPLSGEFAAFVVLRTPRS